MTKKLIQSVKNDLIVDENVFDYYGEKRFISSTHKTTATR